MSDSEDEKPLAIWVPPPPSQEGWCSVCGCGLDGESAAGSTCARRDCQVLSRLRSRPALRPFARRAQRTLLWKARVDGGGIAGVPAEAKQETPLAEAPVETTPTDVQQPAKEQAMVFPGELPQYQRIRRNIQNYGRLASAKDGDDLGLCGCVGACKPSTCLNAVLAIECRPENCSLREDEARSCGNRRFAAREAAEKDVVEVFWTGEAKGFGLRALERMEKGTLVAEYVGEVVPKNLLRAWRYSMHLSGRAAIDASRAGGPARFMNHSCRPNCYAQRWVVAGEWRVGLFAGRDIDAMEELTFSYAKCGRGGYGQAGAQEACHCGEAGCTGVVGGARAAEPVVTGGTTALVAALTNELEEVPPEEAGSVVSERAPPATTEQVQPAVDMDDSEGVPPAAAEQVQQGINMDDSLVDSLAAMAARRSAAKKDGPPHWPHAQWLCGLLFGEAPVASLFSAGLAPWLAHAFPSQQQLAAAADLFLPRSLALARQAWLSEVTQLPGMTPLLGKLLREALGDGEPCAVCGGAAPRLRCEACGRAAHAGCLTKGARRLCRACAQPQSGCRAARLAEALARMRKPEQAVSNESPIIRIPAERKRLGRPRRMRPAEAKALAGSKEIGGSVRVRRRSELAGVASKQLCFLAKQKARRSKKVQALRARASLRTRASKKVYALRSRASNVQQEQQWPAPVQSRKRPAVVEKVARQVPGSKMLPPELVGRLQSFHAWLLKQGHTPATADTYSGRFASIRARDAKPWATMASEEYCEQLQKLDKSSMRAFARYWAAEGKFL